MRGRHDKTIYEIAQELREPVASPQATSQPTGDGSFIKICEKLREEYDAAQPAAGTTPEPLPCGCECACDCGFCEHCQTHTSETFKRLCAAERKLAENGIVWEEGKGYVFNGKS